MTWVGGFRIRGGQVKGKHLGKGILGPNTSHPTNDRGWSMFKDAETAVALIMQMECSESAEQPGGLAPGHHPFLSTPVSFSWIRSHVF